MLKKVFVLLLVIALCLPIWACKKNVTEQPDRSTNQTQNTENSAQTGNTENVENTEHSENTEQSPAQNDKLLTVADWQVDVPNYLSYDAYFSTKREIDISLYKFWVKGDSTFTLYRNVDLETPLRIKCFETGEWFGVPIAEEFASYEVLGADGYYGYLRDESRFVRVNLATGETDVLLDGQKFVTTHLYDNLLLYYASYLNNTFTIGRLYLPTQTQEILYQTQGEFYNLKISKMSSNKASITWTLFNPAFVELLKNEFTNPNSQYKKKPLYGGTEYLDYSAYWEAENGLELALGGELGEPLFVRFVQNTSGIDAYLKCVYDPVSGELEQKTGAVNDHYGSSETQAHYNKEITSLSAPEFLMTPWKDFPVNIPAMNESQLVHIDLAVVCGVDSGKYMYVKTDGDYKKIAETPVCWAERSGSYILYASADRKTVYATKYDGSETVKLYSATYGDIKGCDVGLEGKRIAIQDGDTLIVIDLIERQYRELARNPYLGYFYFDSDFDGTQSTESDRIYFDVNIGLLRNGYTLNVLTGEVRQGYRR